MLQYGTQLPNNNWPRWPLRWIRIPALPDKTGETRQDLARESGAITADNALCNDELERVVVERHAFSHDLVEEYAVAIDVRFGRVRLVLKHLHRRPARVVVLALRLRPRVIGGQA